MVSMITVDGLREVIADLTKAESESVDTVRSVAKRGAQNIKAGLSENLASSTHFKGIAGSVSYDESTRLGTVEYEVGPDKQRSGGALANIAFFGGSGWGGKRSGGTVDLDGPVRAEAERFRSELGRAVGKLL